MLQHWKIIHFGTSSQGTSSRGTGSQGTGSQGTGSQATGTKSARSLFFATCGLAMALFAASAQAEMVVANLDFNVGFSGTTQSGAAAVGSAGDAWNASPTFFGFLGTEAPAFPGDPNAGNTGGGTQGAFELLDTAGLPSGVSYQMTFTNDGFGFNGAFENLGAVPATSAANLLGDYAYVGTADAGDALNFQLSGLSTDTSYSLYLYGNGDQPGQGATWSMDGISLTSAFDGTSSFDEGGEFVKFDFSTGADTTKLFVASELGGAIAVNGFQLSVAAIPEPSSFALMSVVGLVGMVKRKRRRS